MKKILFGLLILTLMTSITALDISDWKEISELKVSADYSNGYSLKSSTRYDLICSLDRNENKIIDWGDYYYEFYDYKYGMGSLRNVRLLYKYQGVIC